MYHGARVLQCCMSCLPGLTHAKAPSRQPVHPASHFLQLVMSLLLRCCGMPHSPWRVHPFSGFFPILHSSLCRDDPQAEAGRLISRDCPNRTIHFFTCTVAPMLHRSNARHSTPHDVNDLCELNFVSVADVAVHAVGIQPTHTQKFKPDKSLPLALQLHQHLQQSQDSCIVEHAFATCLSGPVAPRADTGPCDLKSVCHMKFTHEIWCGHAGVRDQLQPPRPGSGAVATMGCVCQSQWY